MTDDAPVTAAGWEEKAHPRGEHGKFRKLDEIMGDLTKATGGYGGSGKVGQARSAIREGKRAQARTILSDIASGHDDPQVKALASEAVDRLKPLKVGKGREVPTSNHSTPDVVHDVTHPDHGNIGTITKATRYNHEHQGRIRVGSTNYTRYRAAPPGAKGPIGGVKEFRTRAEAEHHLAEHADAKAAESTTPGGSPSPGGGSSEHLPGVALPTGVTVEPNSYEGPQRGVRNHVVKVNNTPAGEVAVGVNEAGHKTVTAKSGQFGSRKPAANEQEAIDQIVQHHRATNPTAPAVPDSPFHSNTPGGTPKPMGNQRPDPRQIAKGWLVPDHQNSNHSGSLFDSNGNRFYRAQSGKVMADRPHPDVPAPNARKLDFATPEEQNAFERTSARMGAAPEVSRAQEVAGERRDVAKANADSIAGENLPVGYGLMEMRAGDNHPVGGVNKGGTGTVHVAVHNVHGMVGPERRTRAEAIHDVKTHAAERMKSSADALRPAPAARPRPPKGAKGLGADVTFRQPGGTHRSGKVVQVDGQHRIVESPSEHGLGTERHRVHASQISPAGDGTGAPGTPGSPGPTNAEKINNAATMYGHGSPQHRQAIERFGKPQTTIGPRDGGTPAAPAAPTPSSVPGRSAKMQRAFQAASEGDHAWLAGHGFNATPGDKIHVHDRQGNIALQKPNGEVHIQRVNGNGQAHTVDTTGTTVPEGYRQVHEPRPGAAPQPPKSEAPSAPKSQQADSLDNAKHLGEADSVLATILGTQELKGGAGTGPIRRARNQFLVERQSPGQGDMGVAASHLDDAYRQMSGKADTLKNATESAQMHARAEAVRRLAQRLRSGDLVPGTETRNVGGVYEQRPKA